MLRCSWRIASFPGCESAAKAASCCTSSVEALIGCPYSAAYSASKAFVKSFGEALWGELTPEGIDVLTICPGATDTEALGRHGIDPATLPNVMSPDAVAKLALENLNRGPVLITSEHYKATFEQLLSMPRRDALTAMAARMKPEPRYAGQSRRRGEAKRSPARRS